ncbi:MAG: hypothetical protein BJ554DRAFT_1614, partial [Olpidium bornovanus]
MSVSSPETSQGTPRISARPAREFPERPQSPRERRALVPARERGRLAGSTHTLATGRRQISNVNFFGGSGGHAAEAKYRRKHRELLKRIRDVEGEYDLLMLTLERSKQRVARLRVERSLLFEKLESLYQGDLSDADLFGDYVHAPPDAHKASTDGANGSLQPPCGVGERCSPAPAAVGGKSGKGRARQPPDPNAPKRPANAFMVFCSMMRKEEHKKAPDTLSQSDTTKLLAQRWNGMSREEQRQFYDLYEKDKERYAQEMSAYQAAGNATALTQNEELGAVDSEAAVAATTIAADEKVH